MSEPIVWTAAAVLMLLGVVGAVAPGLPGAPLILAAAIMVRWLLPGYVSVWTLVVLGAMCVLSLAAEWAAAAVGAKAFGGSRRAMIAAPIGAILGLPFGLFGLITGAILAAVIAEGALANPPKGVARPDATKSLLAGIGAGLGVLAGTAAKLGFALAMCFWLIADFLVN